MWETREIWNLENLMSRREGERKLALERERETGGWSNQNCRTTVSNLFFDTGVFVSPPSCCWYVFLFFSFFLLSIFPVLHVQVFVAIFWFGLICGRTQCIMPANYNYPSVSRSMVDWVEFSGGSRNFSQSVS